MNADERDDKELLQAAEVKIEPVKPKKLGPLEQVLDLLKLAVPIFFAFASTTAMRTTDTAILGHVGTEYLAASALSDLWTQTTGVFLQGRVLGVFVGQAIGAGNKRLGGVWLQVSITVLACISVVVFGLWMLTKPLLIAFGIPEVTASNAGYYAMVCAFALPARVCSTQLAQFFQAQRIMKPGVIASAGAMVLNLILGLVLVLGLGVPNWNGFRFYVCPIVTTAIEWAQLVFIVVVFCKINQLHKPAWPIEGWTLKHVSKERVSKFVRLYAPDALTISSDFLRFALIGALAASLGNTQLAVFNSSYRILWICLAIVGSIAASVSIKLATFLGAGDASSAKHIAHVGIALVLCILVGLSALILMIPRYLGSIFSNEEEVLDFFEDIRFPFAAMMFAMTLSVTLEKIPQAMGRAKLLLALGLVGSWVGQVPGVVLCLHFWRSDLIGLYTGVTLGYALLDLLLLFIILKSDWQKYADEARKRSEVEETKDVPLEDMEAGEQADAEAT